MVASTLGGPSQRVVLSHGNADDKVILWFPSNVEVYPLNDIILRIIFLRSPADLV